MVKKDETDDLMYGRLTTLDNVGSVNKCSSLLPHIAPWPATNDT